jgi:hypothetical protein
LTWIILKTVARTYRFINYDRAAQDAGKRGSIGMR